jgi:tRNA uridine 5-carbamoylmethylation protein Kti12
MVGSVVVSLDEEMPEWTMPQSTPPATDYKASRRRVLDTLHTLNSKVVVLDDTMHVKSMRHDVYTLCQHNAWTFVQIHVHASLSTVLERNQLREKKVPEHIIFSMRESMAWNTGEYWQHYGMQWDSTGDDTAQLDRLREVMEHCRTEQEKQRHLSLERSMSKQITADSLAHTLHQQLNQAIHTFVGTLPTTRLDPRILQDKRQFYNQHKHSLTCIDSLTQQFTEHLHATYS